MINYQDGTYSFYKVWFNHVEFVLVTDLIFNHDTKVSNYVDCVERPQLKEEHFLDIIKALTYLDIRECSWGTILRRQ